MRSVVFGCRRVLWLYLICRDIYLFDQIRARYGSLSALLPPLVSALLLVLDRLWWREHAASQPRESTHDHVTAIECLELIADEVGEAVAEAGGAIGGGESARSAGGAGQGAKSGETACFTV